MTAQARVRIRCAHCRSLLGQAWFEVTRDDSGVLSGAHLLDPQGNRLAHDPDEVSARACTKCTTTTAGEIIGEGHGPDRGSWPMTVRVSLTALRPAIERSARRGGRTADHALRLALP